jgi:ABC-type nitrate/sulfonate/bicarbonate transport system permease component
VSRVRRYAAPVALILLLLGAWELAARWDLISNALSIEDFLVPAPSDIAKSLWEDRSLLSSNAWVTLKEVVLGFAIAAVAGIGFALLIHLSEVARRAVYPLLIASQTIPIVILAPILVVWFGFGLTPKLVIVALICFFPITVNTLDGLRSVDPDLIKLMRALGAGRFQRLWRVEAPSALPYAFSGAKVAVSVSVIGAVFAEYVGSSSGLGHLINQAQAQLLTARSFAAVVVLSAIAILLFALVSIIERRVVTWESRGVTRS